MTRKAGLILAGGGVIKKIRSSSSLQQVKQSCVICEDTRGELHVHKVCTWNVVAKEGRIVLPRPTTHLFMLDLLHVHLMPMLGINIIILIIR